MNCLGHRCSQWKSRPWLSKQTGFPKIIDPIWNEPVSTGNAGALARYKREAENNYSGNKILD